MEPHLQRVEVETAPGRDDNLAVDDAAVRELFNQSVMQFGKVAIEGTKIAALDVDVSAPAKHDCAESVPLRLVQERTFWRELLGQFGEHRLDRRVDREYGRTFGGHRVRRIL